MRNSHATAEKKLLQVVAFQVPDEVQAHRCNITDSLPPRIRTVQPRVLVNVPVSPGNGRRVNNNQEEEDDDTLGSRDVARGHLYHSHSHSRDRLSRNHQHYHFNEKRTNHHHNNHHHHHHHNNSTNSYNRQRSRHNNQQSPTLSTTNGDIEGGGSCGSPDATSQRLPSRRSSTSPTSSRMLTPSPPTIHIKNNNGKKGRKFSHLPLSQTEKCCFGLLPRRWFTCHAKGSARIDVLARFAFPLMFVFFNFAYWSMYLFRNEDNEKMS